jgi:hypothetical protein
MTQSARKPSVNSMMLDSPNLWPQTQTDRSAVSSSVGSISMLADEDSDDSTSDDDVMDDMDDQLRRCGRRPTRRLQLLLEITVPSCGATTFHQHTPV